ncbi:MAG: LysM peptidoglycan-binding domain-containing protein [Prevotella sp.]|nr:LysM peptidoglycan-binding domain-containing protein [Prevotella sp.]
MARVLRYFGVFVLLFVVVGTVSSQVTESIRGLHKVKKKETIFGISRMYEITIEELINANPEMKEPGYELKKGDVIRIPYPGQATAAQSDADNTSSGYPKKPDDLRGRALRLGVMLPLHDINGDGRRMVEYYRGVLMACDSLKKEGISVNVHAWNTAEDCDINKVLDDKAAADCDLIIGPLYSKQMDALSDFVEKNDIRLVIPFSINAPQLTTNPNIFRIWQSPTEVNEATIGHFLDHFKGYHPIFVDCNDSTSKKGQFTAGLRRQLEQRDILYSLTNLKSGENDFSKAFSRTQPNVVILNTGRSQELGVAFSKINGLKVNNPELVITMFGYADWLLYIRTHLDNFYKYNAYIPSVFYYDPLSAGSKRIQQKFRWNFHADMQNSLPRFAITGFDHAYFFLKGIHQYGRSFSGAAGMLGYPAIQTPLQFERYGNGGFRNKTLLFVHYTPEHRVEVTKF